VFEHEALSEGLPVANNFRPNIFSEAVSGKGQVFFLRVRRREAIQTADRSDNFSFLFLSSPATETKARAMASSESSSPRQESRWLDITSEAVIPAKRKNFRWLKTLLMRGAGSIRTVPTSDAPLRPTAYLDGLRGFAAFMVYWHHHELWSHASQPNLENAYFENAFGWGGKYYFATFYGIRNFFTGGHLAVAVFYVISGYVLSVKPLKLIQSGEHATAAEYMGSSLFRRWFRLYLPCAITTFLYVTSWHVFGIWNSNCAPLETYGKELWRWYDEFKGFSFVFKETMVPWVSYNVHLWSIPLEMRGSIIIWTVLLALSRATVRWRLICQAVLIFYFLYIVDGYYGALFIAGMLHCDLDLLARLPDGLGFPQWIRRFESWKTILSYTAFALFIFLSGVPTFNGSVEKMRESPLWYYLSYLKPQAMYDPKWFFLFIAANLLVGSVPRLPWLKRFFETRFCQYLGRISFALYLVHGPILATLGDRVYYAVGWVRPIELDNEKLAAWMNLMPLPKTGPMGLEIAFLVPHVVLLPFTLWIADLVTRTIDEPSVKFAQWLFKLTQEGDDVPPKPEEAMRLA
jgi:peptidoglycan/LPS O-acetylase OafA/YrhL